MDDGYFDLVSANHILSINASFTHITASSASISALRSHTIISDAITTQAYHCNTFSASTLYTAHVACSKVSATNATITNINGGIADYTVVMGHTASFSGQINADSGSFTSLYFKNLYSLAPYSTMSFTKLKGTTASFNKYVGSRSSISIGTFGTVNTNVLAPLKIVSNNASIGHIIATKGSFTNVSFANLSLPSTIKGTKGSFTNVSATNIKMSSNLIGSRASFNVFYGDDAYFETSKGTLGSFVENHGTLSSYITHKGYLGSFSVLKCSDSSISIENIAGIKSDYISHTGALGSFTHIKGTMASIESCTLHTASGTVASFTTFKGTKCSFTKASFSSLILPQILGASLIYGTKSSFTNGSFINIKAQQFSCITITASSGSISNIRSSSFYSNNATITTSLRTTNIKCNFSSSTTSITNINKGTKASFTNSSFTYCQSYDVDSNTMKARYFSAGTVKSSLVSCSNVKAYNSLSMFNGSTDNGTIKSSGIVSWPRNPYLHLHNNTLINVPINAWTTIALKNVVQLTTGSYSTSNGIYVAPSSGVYLINTFFAFNITTTWTDSDEYSIRIYSGGYYSNVDTRRVPKNGAFKYGVNGVVTFSMASGTMVYTQLILRAASNHSLSTALGDCEIHLVKLA